MGRAAPIAFAREGADVAINYFPSEEPDAQQVIELIRAEERKGLALRRSPPWRRHQRLPGENMGTGVSTRLSGTNGQRRQACYSIN